MQHPVIVVGAGLAGLTAAARIARAGLPVTVIAGSGAPGGRARTTARDGHLLNLGPHGLATRGVGTAVLEELGVDLPGRSPDLTATRLLVDGRIVHPLARRDGGPGARALAALVRLGSDVRHVTPDGSVADLLDRHAGDGHTLAALTALGRLATYADSLDAQAADVMAEQTSGGQVRYLDGGWGALVARLRTAAEVAGAEVRVGTAVHRVRPAAGVGEAHEVVLADGSTRSASAVVLAAGGPGDAAGLVEGAAAGVLAGWADRATPVPMAVLDVALARRPRMPALVLGTDEPLYLSVHSDRAALAPEGGAVVHLARYLPAGGGAPAGTRERLEALLDLAADRWRDQVVHARYLPAITVTHDAALVQTGGVAGRPGPAVPVSPGLLVAGDWVGRRGYLAQGTIASADEAADLAVAHVRGRTDVRDRQVA